MHTNPSTSLRRRLRAAPVAILAVGALALAACSSSGNAFDSSGSGGAATTAAASGGGTVVVGSQAFTEAKIMQAMYVQLLENAGFTVQTKNGERAVLTDALKSGQIDVMPDYLGSTLNFIANDVKGTKGKTYSSSDSTKELSDFKGIGDTIGIAALTPASAQDQNAFYVTKKFAADNGNLTTLSQLAALNKPLKLGADTFCGAETQPYCINGLKKTYGFTNLTLDDSYQFGSVKTAQDVVDGKIDIGETGTTDGTLDAKGLMILQDDKKLQPAENLTPFINIKDASDPKIAEVLNKLGPVLTTEDLTALNAKVDAERQKPEDVAKAYLQSKGLLS